MSRTESNSSSQATANVKGGLEEYERETEGRLPFYLTKREVKLLAIAGVCLSFLRMSHDHTHLHPLHRLVSSSMVSFAVTSHMYNSYLNNVSSVAYDLFIINVCESPHLTDSIASHPVLSCLSSSPSPQCFNTVFTEENPSPPASQAFSKPLPILAVSSVRSVSVRFHRLS